MPQEPKIMTWKGKGYRLTSTQLTKLARLCVQEQGNGAAPAEASLMANLYELHGQRYSSLYDYVRNGGWFYKAPYYMDHGSASARVIEAVKDVLVNGNRVLPLYIDEHDCFSDIVSATNNGNKISKTNRSAYKKGVTVIKNRYSSTYTFYCFPSAYSDPFGYTANSRAPKRGEAPQDDGNDEVRVNVSASLPELSEGDTGRAVRVWQVIVGAEVDGSFGAGTEAATKTWQNKHGLTADGIVGAKSWKKGLSLL